MEGYIFFTNLLLYFKKRNCAFLSDRRKNFPDSIHRKVFKEPESPTPYLPERTLLEEKVICLPRALLTESGPANTAAGH